jgi:hypothetical protein
LTQFQHFAEDQLAAEKAEREETEQALSILWEQTCRKIEDAKGF